MVGGQLGLKFFEDKELTKPLEFIHFGTVEAGKSTEKQIWVFNDTKAFYRNLKFTVKGEASAVKEVKIVEYPQGIDPGVARALLLVWNPSKTLRQALEISLLIEGEEIYMSNRDFGITKSE